MTNEIETKRIYLSPPFIGQSERDAVMAAMESGWVAPLGPEVDSFENDFAKYCDVKHAVALSSGSAAIHLGLKAIGLNSGDEVVIPTLTFAATAFAASYVGVKPIFLDSEKESWNLDANLLKEFLDLRANVNQLPKAVIAVDIFGRSCDYSAILEVAEMYELPVFADSAEALGAKYKTRMVGGLGSAAAFSFNGNKIITTSGGGMFVTNDDEQAKRVRHWATQSREPFPWYEHNEIGYNYRLSNLLAALGRKQLDRLPEILSAREMIRKRYSENFSAVSGIEVVGDPSWGTSNNWITNVIFDSKQYVDAPTRVRLALESVNVESRHTWKPMHLQPVFKGSESFLNGTAEKIFNTGLCLPSGTGMTLEEVDFVSSVVLQSLSD